MMKMTSYKTKLPKEVKEYIDIVHENKNVVNKERLQLIDYIDKVFQNEELFYDVDQIEKYLSYQKYFPFELFPWEKFLFVLHNCIFRKDGLPRWSDLFIIMGRGGGKNGYLSFEDFCLLTPTNGIYQYDIDISANSEEQAKTTFQEILSVLENPKYIKKFKKNFYWNQTIIRNKKTDSTLRYRTNNPKGKDGLRSGKVDFDEPHAYENWDNINVFTTGLGKKPHPRRTYISTNGDIRDGVLDNLIEKSQMILNGELPDNGFLPFICKLDDEKEVDDILMWRKANPSLEYLPSLLEQMKKEYADYKINPIVNNAFMTKRMNIPQGSKDIEVTSWENILKTNREVPSLDGLSCVVGIDYSKTTDFVSAFLLFKQDNIFYGVTHTWVCSKSNDLPRIKAPLKEWESMRLLTFVNDVEINPKIVTDWLQSECNSHNYRIEKLAIDSYRYTLMSGALKKAGFDANDKEKVKLVRPSDIMRIVPTIDSVFVTSRIIWGDNPLMRWATNNAKLEPAPNNNFKYGKIEPKSRKTDPFMAFVHAMTLTEDVELENNELVFIDTFVF